MNESSALLVSARPRSVRQIFRGQNASDGAGVRLVRLIGSGLLPDLDPFLLLDAFGSDEADDYIAGFPDHPHRGFETVTYMLDGRMRHRDNHGHEGLLGPGSVQWMTAGRGIVHSEMPEQEQGLMRGFQLWVNLPARDKMTAPRYQEFAADRIPSLAPADGVFIKVIAGQVGEIAGVIEQPATDPIYLDIGLAPDTRTSVPVPRGHNAFVHVFAGSAKILAGSAESRVDAGQIAILGDGDGVVLQSLNEATRVLLVAGRPLREPVARRGPFVMNTQAELVQAFDDFRAGHF